VGTPHGTRKRSLLPRARRPRQRICLRKGCRRKYQPRRWNQRYCQVPECQREVKRWQAARRQAQRRRDDRVKARHVQAEKQRRQRAKVAPQSIASPEVVPTRGHAADTAEKFFSSPLCDRPGCYEPRVISLRNKARYCCAGCRQAVRKVHDRERKWLFRGTSAGCDRRAEYAAARRRRSRGRRGGDAAVPPHAPPR
jgi:hypothetical protein